MSDGELQISNDLDRMDLETVCSLVQHSYWGRGRPREQILRSFAHSICFGAFLGEQQVGFARVVSDRTYFAYLFDFIIFEAFRGKGFSKKLLSAILSHEELRGVSRFMLSTKDAHGLYRKFGFEFVGDPSRLMERMVPEL